MYFDTSYIAKFYLNEAESPKVRELVRKADVIHSSLWALAEFHAVLHRHVREGALPVSDARKIAVRFSRRAPLPLPRAAAAPRARAARARAPRAPGST